MGAYGCSWFLMGVHVFVCLFVCLLVCSFICLFVCSVFKPLPIFELNILELRWISSLRSLIDSFDLDRIGNKVQAGEPQVKYILWNQTVWMLSSKNVINKKTRLAVVLLVKRYGGQTHKCCVRICCTGNPGHANGVFAWCAAFGMQQLCLSDLCCNVLSHHSGKSLQPWRLIHDQPHTSNQNKQWLGMFSLHIL